LAAAQAAFLDEERRAELVRCLESRWAEALGSEKHDAAD
jgi:hypothetical protein